MGPARRYFMGLDLGQARDFTALAVLERPLVQPGDPPSQRRPAYALRHLHRFPLGTPYPEVAREVVRLLRTPPLPGALLTVDQTGVGRAVVDMLADALRDNVTCAFCPVTLTGGHAVTAGEEGGLRVPKKALVGAVQVLLQTQRLHIARSLPDAPLLVRAFENCRVQVTASANETVEAWREGQHDELVLAVALAAWVGEQALPPLADPPRPPPLPRIVVPQ